MRLLKCPKFGEMFSDTYKTCPFCQEDEERHSSKPVKSAGHRTGGGRAKPKVGGGVVIVCLVLVLGLAAYTIFGNQITAFFTGEKDAPTPEPAVLTMNKTSVELTVGSSFALTVSGADKVAFSSSDEAVATVSANGTVQAVSTGSAVITASAADTTATCRVAVTAAVDQPADPVTPDVPDTPVTPDTPAGKDLVLQSIYGSRGQFSFNVGETAPLEVDGTDATVTWSSSDTKIATVDASGVVTAVSSGKATITASVEGQTLTIEVLVW
ncbi:MAG: Ig domain-containing protein [Clostridiales bacterium]|nr:Ig domain-containing protein [Clostridiales bacterium]